MMTQVAVAQVLPPDLGEGKLVARRPEPSSAADRRLFGRPVKAAWGCSLTHAER